VYGVRERGAFSAWCVQCKQKEEEGEKRNPKKARGQRGEVSMPTGVLIPYAPPGADSVLEASVEKGGHMCTESESAVRSACGATGDSARMPAGGGKSGTLKKHKGSTGELSMPYAPPGADSVLEVSAERS